MRRTSIFLIFVALAMVTHSQAAKKDTLVPTTKILSRLSYYWKLDSLAGNGFRLHTCNQLLKSKLDGVTKKFLVKSLGKPNQLRDTNHGTEYVYYYFDIKAMPKDYDAPIACWLLPFNLSQMKTMLQKL